MSMCNERRDREQGPEGCGARRTYRSLLGRVTELARELVIQDLLTSKDIEEIRKGVESVVKSGA